MAMTDRVRHLVVAFLQLARDRVAIWRLRREIERLKLREYDLMVENMRGLRRALETQQRAQQDLARQIDARDAQIAKLREEYTALEARLSQSSLEAMRGERLVLFKRIQSVVTQLPTLRAAVEAGADLSARDVLDLMAPLSQALSDLGFEVIGEAGAEVRYDPRHHSAVGRGARSVAPDDRVRIRYVGFLYNGDVVCKAQVTRVE